MYQSDQKVNILIYFIAPLNDIQMCYIKYLTMDKMHMHAGAIRELLYGYAYVREIIHSLKLVDYLPVHTHNHTITYTCRSSGTADSCELLLPICANQITLLDCYQRNFFAYPYLLLLDFSLTVKAAPHECVIRTIQP